MNKFNQCGVVLLTVLLVGGCSSTKSRGTDNVAESSMAATSSEAQSFGIGNEANVLGADGGPTADLLGTRSFYFDFDRYVVHEQDKAAIQAHADYLLSHSDAHIVIEGNTDMRGSREYNIGLGHRRANAIAESLRKAGVPDRQVRTLSYGEERPIALGHTEEAYRVNRRADIVYEANR